MNRDTEILVGSSGIGKTSELIKRSAESGIYILVANRKRAEFLVKQATDMKLYIPFPVTLQEWLSSSNRFHGSSIHRDGILIDDIDDVIKELFLPIEIKAVTLRTPRVITNLDQPVDDVAEVRHGEWKPDLIDGIPYKDEIYGYIFKCSVCGKSEVGATYTIECRSKYCPHCGAKMDGERREE